MGPGIARSDPSDPRNPPGTLPAEQEAKDTSEAPHDARLVGTLEQLERGGEVGAEILRAQSTRRRFAHATTGSRSRDSEAGP